MSTQYDGIQGPYDYMRTRSIALIERENVRTTVTPFLPGARVLDLACGSGFYTYKMLDWGARSALGVDISSVMIEQAKRQGLARKDDAQARVSFIHADCAKPTSFPHGPFDVVFAAWLLNYAPDGASMIAMLRNVARNLRPGGHFVTVTVPVAANPMDSIDAERTARPPPDGSGCLVYSKLADVDDGVLFRAHGDTPVGEVSFDCYHLRRDVYESAIVEAGLELVRWGATEVPSNFLAGDAPGGATLRELQTYETVPNYSVLVVKKPDV